MYLRVYLTKIATSGFYVLKLKTIVKMYF